jgi:antitoxin component of RelBE/YafQ-DinJ toxin-antitoxin module
MNTSSRNFRCDDELWAAAKAAADAEGRTVTDVIVAALRRLVAGY